MTAYARIAAIAALCVSAGLACAAPGAAYQRGPSCGEVIVQGNGGVKFRVLFAKNGAVQQYIVLTDRQNPELVNDARIALDRIYGPAGVDAPPLRIVSFKPGSGGMMIPDKAVDSCGRTVVFH